MSRAGETCVHVSQAYVSRACARQAYASRAGPAREHLQARGDAGVAGAEVHEAQRQDRAGPCHIGVDTAALLDATAHGGVASARQARGGGGLQRPAVDVLEEPVLDLPRERPADEKERSREIGRRDMGTSIVHAVHALQEPVLRLPRETPSARHDPPGGAKKAPPAQRPAGTKPRGYKGSPAKKAGPPAQRPAGSKKGPPAPRPAGSKAGSRFPAVPTGLQVKPVPKE